MSNDFSRCTDEQLEDYATDSAASVAWRMDARDEQEHRARQYVRPAPEPEDRTLEYVGTSDGEIIPVTMASYRAETIAPTESASEHATRQRLTDVDGYEPDHAPTCPTCEERGYQVRTSHDLQVGDVIQYFGLRLRVDVVRPSTAHPTGGEYGPCIVTHCSHVGFTSAAAEIEADDPMSSAAYILRSISQDGYWNCQGNRLARWAVESR